MYRFANEKTLKEIKKMVNENKVFMGSMMRVIERGVLFMRVRGQ